MVSASEDPDEEDTHKEKAAESGDDLLKHRKRSQSGFVGVYRRGMRWTAEIKRNKPVGTYDTALEAARAGTIARARARDVAGLGPGLRPGLGMGLGLRLGMGLGPVPGLDMHGAIMLPGSRIMRLVRLVQAKSRIGRTNS